MKTLTEILPDLFVVEVPMDAENIHIQNQFLYYLINYESKLYGIALFGEYDLLGTCTKDEISFDTRGIVDRFNNGAWRDYADKTFAPDQDSPNFFLTSKESFYSLLLKHGLYSFEKLVVIKKL